MDADKQSEIFDLCGQIAPLLNGRDFNVTANALLALLHSIVDGMVAQGAPESKMMLVATLNEFAEELGVENVH